MTASSQRAVAQHQAQIRDLKRRILISTPLMGAYEQKRKLAAASHG